MKKVVSAVLIALFISFFSLVSIEAHPGRTDANGGHYNRKTGGYHYHNGGRASSSKTDVNNTAEIKKIQQKLNELGFDCGEPDGVMGEKTEQAIKDFQASKGLEPDGIVGQKTKEALGL